MKSKLFTILLVMVLFVNKGITQNNTAVVTKVTASWCPFCGTWGWDFYEEIKNRYNNDNRAVLLGVHHSGDLRNNTSSWFAKNLKFFYQPEFFVNNAELDVSSSTWMNKFDKLEEEIDAASKKQTNSQFSFVNAFIDDNNELVCNINFQPMNTVSNDHYLAVYIFENNVENNQASRGLSMHPNVLRDVMSNNAFGDLYISAGESSVAENQIMEFKKPKNINWNGNNVGLLAIMWKKVGDDYIVDSSKAIYNIGLLSATNDIEENIAVKVKTLSQSVEISIDDDASYNLNLIDLNGMIVYSNKIVRNINIATKDLPTGIYAIQVFSGTKVYTQQVFIP
jgi:hypothetical protein